jgi:WD40 repeat protein
MFLRPLVLLLLSTLLSSPVCWAEKPGKIPVTEQVSSRLVPNRLSEFKVSPDGLSVAYTVGSGCHSDEFGIEGDSDWEFKTLVVNGQPEGRGNRWYENTSEAVYSPDRRQFARVNAHYSASGPSYIELNGHAQKSYGQVYAPLFSPDSKHFAYIAQTEDPYGEFVVFDGNEGKHYGLLAKDRNLKFSPDSQRFAYIVSDWRNNELFAVIDGKEGNRYSWIDIYFATFSPDSKHFAYTIRMPDMKWAAVVDGIEGRHFEAKGIRDLMFSPDSKRIAYQVTIGYDGGGAFVVVGDQIGKQFRTLWPDKIRFSFDSQHFAYAASDGKKWFIVVDHQEVRSHDSVFQITYSPVDQQLAYVAYENKKMFVVHDGVPGKKYDSITDLTFSPDGKSLAYAAYDKRARQWFVVINGRETPAYDFVLAHNAAEAGRSVLHSSFKFESADTLRFLAVRKKNILLVRARFGQDANPHVQ